MSEQKVRAVNSMSAGTCRHCTPVEIDKRPWECAEYLKASEYLRKVWPPHEPQGWQPIETAPKDKMIDVWFVRSDGSGDRHASCYYDRICDEWRTSRPGGVLVAIKARSVTHWMPLPSAPVTKSGEQT